MHKGGLKKEFKESDIQRIRNLVRKDVTKKTKSQTGYKKNTGTYSEGDVWKENGREWTIKNGIKQNVTKLDNIKRSIRIPLCCPKCKGPMKSDLHKQIYKIHKMCLNCFMDYEDTLRKNGLLKNKLKNLRQANLQYFINEVEQSINFLDDGIIEDFVTEQGDVEHWKVNKKQINKRELEKITEYLDHLKSMLD